MLQPISQTERALRDTLIPKAEGLALDRLATFYDLDRPDPFTDSAWRRALRAVVKGPRGTLGCTHDFIEALYAGSATEWGVTLAVASPKIVTWASGPAADFGCEHVGRFARIKYIPATAAGFDDTVPQAEWPWVEELFYTTGPDFSGGPTSSTLELAPYNSGYWKGCDWATGPTAVDPAHLDATMTLLAFVYLEPTPGPLTDDPDETVTAPYGATCEFQLYVDADLFSAPVTYLLDDTAVPGIDRDVVDAAMPDQGHIMDEYNLDEVVPTPPTAGDQGAAGPRPIYLAGVDDTVANLLDPLLAAGVQATTQDHEFCA
jgi:hypothetical protein